MFFKKEKIGLCLKKFHSFKTLTRLFLLLRGKKVVIARKNDEAIFRTDCFSIVNLVKVNHSIYCKLDKVSSCYVISLAQASRLFPLYFGNGYVRDARTSIGISNPESVVLV